MFSNRSVSTLTLSLVLATQTLSGCDTSDLVASYPALSPIIGPRPQAKPFQLGRGHIAGVVVTTDGVRLGNAFVTTGGAFSFTAELPEDQEGLDALPYVPNENDNRDRVYVENGLFVNENGEEEEGPAFRIIRKFPPSNSFQDKYYYLRNGEFLLEGIPEGESLITASFQDVQGAAQRFTIFPNFLLRDTRFTLDLPEPLRPDASGRAPAVVDWVGIEPPTGITLTVTERQTLDALQQPQKETTITYDPNPPDVLVELRSPPGSAGTSISAYTIRYTTGLKKTDGSSFDINEEIVVAIPPKLIPPGQPRGNGPKVGITIPVGSITLQKLFALLDKEGLTPPPIISARIKFRNRAQQNITGALIGDNRSDLEVVVPLRALSQ